MSKKIEAILTALGLFLVGAGLVTFYIDMKNHKIDKGFAYIKALNELSGVTAKEFITETYKVKQSTIVVNNTKADSNAEELLPYIEGAVVSACGTNKFDIVEVEYLIDGKFKTGGAWPCSQINQPTQAI